MINLPSRILCHPRKLYFGTFGLGGGRKQEPSACNNRMDGA